MVTSGKSRRIGPGHGNSGGNRISTLKLLKILRSVVNSGTTIREKLENSILENQSKPSSRGRNKLLFM